MPLARNSTDKTSEKAFKKALPVEDGEEMKNLDQNRGELTGRIDREEGELKVAVLRGHVDDHTPIVGYHFGHHNLAHPHRGQAIDDDNVTIDAAAYLRGEQRGRSGHLSGIDQHSDVRILESSVDLAIGVLAGQITGDHLDLLGLVLFLEDARQGVHLLVLLVHQNQIEVHRCKLSGVLAAQCTGRTRHDDKLALVRGPLDPQAYATAEAVQEQAPEQHERLDGEEEKT